MLLSMFAYDVCILLLHISVALVMWFVSPIHFVRVSLRSKWQKEVLLYLVFYLKLELVFVALDVCLWCLHVIVAY